MATAIRAGDLSDLADQAPPNPCADDRPLMSDSARSYRLIISL